MASHAPAHPRNTPPPQAHHAAWTRGPLSALDPEAVEREIVAAGKALTKLGKARRGAGPGRAPACSRRCPPPLWAHARARPYHTPLPRVPTEQGFAARGLTKMAANCDELRAEVEAFREVAPLAAALRAPGMRQRHWDALSAQVRARQRAGRIAPRRRTLVRALLQLPVSASLGRVLNTKPPAPQNIQIGQPVSLEGGLSLDQALERGLMDHLPAITAAADVAGKEFAIEQVRPDLWLACLLACNVPDPHVLLAVLVGLACLWHRACAGKPQAGASRKPLCLTPLTAAPVRRRWTSSPQSGSRQS